MGYEIFDEETASTEDRIAWTLCQIIDDDAPMRWTRYRGVAQCISLHPSLIQDLMDLKKEIGKKERNKLLRRQ